MFKSALSMLLFSCFLGHLDCTDIKLLTVKRGENATLQCNGTRGAAVIILKWRKSDLQSELENTNKQLYVLFIRENRPHENLQLPSFKGRVQLRDPQMKDGDLSLIIENISMNDAGIYECYAGYDKEEPQLINSINLTVEEPGLGGQSGDGGKKDDVKEDGGEKSDSVGLTVGLPVSVVLLVVGAVGFLIYKKCKNQSNYQPPPDQGIELREVSP